MDDPFAGFQDIEEHSIQTLLVRRKTFNEQVDTDTKLD